MAISDFMELYNDYPMFEYIIDGLGIILIAYIVYCLFIKKDPEIKRSGGNG